MYIIAFDLVYLGVRYIFLSCKDDGDYANKKLKVLMSIFAIGILALPLLSGSADFERYLRNGITTSIVMFSIYLTRYTEVKRKIPIIIVTVFILLGTTTFAWKYWNTSTVGRFQYLPYIARIYKD